MPKDKKIIINDIHDLSRFKSDFDSPKPIDYGLSFSDQSQINESSFVNTELTIEFIDGLRSFYARKDHFSNHLKDALVDNKVNRSIQEILLLEGKKLKSNDMPIKLDDEGRGATLLNEASSTKRKRYKRIFISRGVVLDKTIQKSNFLDNAHRDFNTSSNGDLLRIYTRKDIDKEIFYIVLLDVHHLIADGEYVNKYNKVKDFQQCLTRCKNLLNPLDEFRTLPKYRGK